MLRRRLDAVLLVWGSLASAVGCQCNEGPGLTRLRAQIKATPDALAFGDVPVGASKSLSVTIENKGTDVLHVCVSDSDLASCSTRSIIDPQSAPFQASFGDLDAQHGTWSVERGGMRTVDVQFAPTTKGPVSAKLVLVHDAVNGPTTEIALSGNGIAPDLHLSATVLDFGDTTVDQKKTLDLVLMNPTEFSQPVAIDPINQPQEIFGTSADVDTPPGQSYMGTVPANGSLAVHVWYRPPEIGMHTNMLHVKWCPDCSSDVALKGNGIKPVFELMPASLDFGTVPLETTAHKSFTVRNSGNTPLTINAVGLDAGTPAEFAPTASGALPKVLGQGESLQVDVAYAGMVAAQKMGRIRVDTTAFDDPATTTNESIGFVSVRANSTGPSIVALPPSIAFGGVPLGMNAARNLVIENAGNAPLMIGAINLNAPSAEISLSGRPALPLMVQPSATIQLTVHFAPVTAGSNHATVVVESNDPITPMLTVPIDGTGGAGNACSIAVQPTPIAFGLVERGRTQTLFARISNNGSVDCHVTNLRTTGAHEFSLPAGPQASLTVVAADSKTIAIAYAPTAYGTHMGALELSSDDPGQPNVQVPITGTSAASDLLVVPSSLDFGVVPLSCASPSRNVQLYNVGANNISVTQVYLDPSTPADFQLTAFVTPMVLTPGGQAQITLRFRGTTAAMETGALVIVHSASNVPVVVPLSAKAEQSPTISDSFQQNATSKVDVLFVVDNSSSMANNQMNLGTNFPSFLSTALALNIDFHIGVTTTDVCTTVDMMHWCDHVGEHGALVGATKILTPQTPGLMTEFTNNVTGIGTMGSTQERGLEAAYVALSDPEINGDNAGFLRPDASLAVIAVSDDDDSRMDGIPGGASEVTIPGARSVAFYENFFWNIKGFRNKQQLSFSAVIEEVQGMCNATGMPAEASGVRYTQVAQDTGGEVASLCTTDWGAQLAAVGNTVFGGRRRFTLSSVPVVNQINVMVNGSATPTGWTYDQTSNSVVFDQGSAPAAGSTVTVTYPVAC